MTPLTAAVLAALASVAASSTLPPVISRVSSGGAASPNTTFVIAGAGLFPGTYAHLCPLSGTTPCLTLPPQPSSWEGGVKVTLPADATGIGAWEVSVCTLAQVCSNATQAQTFTINAPRVSWVLGTGDVEGGVEAGGTLQIFGSALAIDPGTGLCAPITALSDPLPPGSMDPSLFPAGGAATLALTRAPPTTPATTIVSLCPITTSGGACTPLPPPTLASCHRIDVQIPPSTPTGTTFTLRVFNGLAGTEQGLGVLGSEMSVTITPPRSLPSTPVLVVGTDCGLVDCFAQVKRSGGGVISIPAGVWEVPSNTVLEVPSGTTVMGVGGGGSVLHWGSNTLPPKGTPAPNAAMACTGPASLSHLTILLTSPAINALVFSGPTGCRGDGLNVTVDVPGFPTWGIGPAFAAEPGSARWRLTNTHLFHRGNCSAQQSWPHNTAYTVWGSRDGLFSNSTVVCYCQGHSTDSSQRIVFDGNAVFSVGQDSQGDGFSTFENPQVLENLYIGRQLDVGNPSAAKKWESMTLDGPGGATFATFASLSSDGTGGEEQTLTLVDPARAGPWGDQNISVQFLGASVSVLYGPGLGGLARVSGFRPVGGAWNTSLVMTLHPPLLTRPSPGLSYLAINPFRGGLVWEGNTYVNDTTWQLWAQATDVILAGTYFQSFPGGGDVRNWPLFYQCPFPAPFSCAWQPNVGVDFLHNTLRCVNMNIVTSDYKGYTPVNLTLALGMTRRGNRLVGGGSMLGSGRTDDVLVEGTVLEGGVCQVGGPTLPPGTINVNAPHTLVR